MTNNDNENKQLKILKHRRSARITLIFGLFLLFIIPIALTRHSFWSIFDFTQTGQIGDTIGGITGPVVNLIAAILVYLSFQQQILANEIQINLINQEKEKERAKVDKELLLLFYNEIKESLNKLEYRSVNKTALQNGRHGIAIKAIEDYVKDCGTYKESIRNLTDFHIRLMTILEEINNYVSTCRNSSRLTLQEVIFFDKRIKIIFLYYLKLPLDGVEEYEMKLKEDEKISKKIEQIEALLKTGFLAA